MTTLSIGIVVIGRDEGERLKRCLQSLVKSHAPIVYVDSGSRDDSVTYARSNGIHVIELDLSIPFTMARARNAGFHALCSRHPEVQAVQFIDGDCEVISGWLEQAKRYLEQHPGCAAVTGFRQERFPEASIWNRIIDFEWKGPVGEITTCGGDVMIRRDLFAELHGFREQMIAGEEPELCVRLRLAGGKIIRLDTPMTLHDADMHQPMQWWLRAQRAGHAYAEGADLQGKSPFRHNIKAVQKIFAWGILFPLFWIAGISISMLCFSAWVTGLFFLAFPLILVAQILRVGWNLQREHGTKPGLWPYAASCVLAKFPQALGLLRYWCTRGKTRQLIEYKGHES